MRNRKAQSGFILRIFSIISYMIVLAVVVMLIRVPSCDSGGKVQETIHSYSPEILQSNADEQLVSYLRTPIPPDIMERIAWAESKDKDFKKFWKGLPNNLGEVREFLEKNPEIYVDRSYEEFLIALHPYVANEAQNVFDVVTKLTFLQKIKETREDRSRELYFSPRMCVDYPDGNGCICQYLDTPEAYRCSLKSIDADPRDNWNDMSSLALVVGIYANATIALPDATLAEVHLDYPAEKIRIRLPKV